MGGALFLREVYRQTGLSERWGQSIAVGRRPSHVDIRMAEMKYRQQRQVGRPVRADARRFYCAACGGTPAAPSCAFIFPQKKRAAEFRGAWGV